MSTETTTYPDLIGRTMTAVEVKGKEEMIFTRDDGRVFKFYHEQNCCESVEIEDVCGELSDLVGAPILQAECVAEESDTDWGTRTFTFYKFATVKGSVTVRWLGESNGYYSESVDFTEVGR
jgi:hypothetical protein